MIVLTRSVADPNPTFHADADPDPIFFQLKREKKISKVRNIENENSQIFKFKDSDESCLADSESAVNLAIMSLTLK